MPKTIRGILIDPHSRTVSEVQFKDTLKAMYELLQCQLVEAVDVGANNTMYIDEEGLFVDNQRYFSFAGRETNPVAGRGLITGFSHMRGENMDCGLELARVAEKVVWRDIELDEIKTTDRDTEDGFVIKTTASFKPREPDDA